MRLLSDNEVSERLALLRQRNWTKDQISDWFGITFVGENYKILQQFQIWSGQNYEAAYKESETIDRCNFEIFLKMHGWITKKAAAVAWAVKEECFVGILTAAVDRHLVEEADTHQAFEGVYSEKFITDFYKKFPSMRSMTFASIDSFYDRLHQAIRDNLKVAVEPSKCVTSQILEKSHYGNSLDIISGDPMSQIYTVFLDINKPLQLRPDSCSALTFVRNERILRDSILGRVPSLTQQEIDLLRQHADQTN